VISDQGYFKIAVAAYGISAIYSIFLWRKGFVQHDRVSYFLAALGCVFHTIAMVKRGYSLSHCPVNSAYEALIFITWAIVSAYLVIGIWGRIRFLGAFAAPVLFILGIFALTPGFNKPYNSQIDFQITWASAHVAIILISFGALGLCAIAGGMYLTQDYNLKYRKFRAVSSLLPPIQRLDIAMIRLLGGGFCLLTLGLISGVALLVHAQDALASYRPKVVWTLCVWILYATLIGGYWRFGFHGRRMAWGAIVGFVFILGTFWTIYLLSTYQNT
jgi:ABC-type uncharacterized transport system permease subunit